MSLNVQYLRAHTHTAAEAVTVVGVNNLLGLAGNLVLLGAAVLAGGLQLSAVHWPSLMVSQALLIVLGGAIVLAALYVRKAARRVLRQMYHQIRQYRKRPGRVLAALANAALMTVMYASVLWCCGWALGVQLSLATFILICSVGTFVGAATPTPGGLVGVEAGLGAGMVAYGVPSGPALAVALLYRLLTYWLPLVRGFVRFVVLRGRLRLVA
jgi:uncharacterized protein (TIRG00374 family)